MPQLYCAPGKERDNSCLSAEALRKIAAAYNQEFGQRVGTINARGDKQSLWQAINERLPACQRNETCWLDQPWMSQLGGDPVIHDAFRPKHPSPNRWQWLSTTDIHDVMIQYEKVYPEFSFLGPVPINFSQLSDKLVDGVKSMNLQTLANRGITKIGIIFNLSPWYPDMKGINGTHWVALWIDQTKKLIAFYDSFGCEAQRTPNCIPPQIVALIQQLTANHPDFTVRYNTVRHQRSTSECGVYSMYFIIEALKGRSVEDLYDNGISDAQINRYRDVYFRP